MRWLIATDLDGTLLDGPHSWTEAAAAVDTVCRTTPDVRIALASSKTVAEMIALAEPCASDPILIFENGAGIAWRRAVLNRRGIQSQQGYEMDCFAQAYAELRLKLEILRRRSAYEFRGFGDMSVAEVAAHTGLDESAAVRARARLGSEPILWCGGSNTLEAFQVDLKRMGLTLERGGRFHHVTSHMNKARAVERIKRLMWRRLGVHVTTLACGDAPNDLEMMQRADYALVFPDESGGYLLPAGVRVAHASHAGPGPWLANVSGIVEFQTQRVLSL